MWGLLLDSIDTPELPREGGLGGGGPVGGEGWAGESNGELLHPMITWPHDHSIVGCDQYRPNFAK
jgi:hypothetical protein